MENTEPSKRSQAQNAAYAIASFIWNTPNKQVHKDRQPTGGCQGPKGDMGRDCLMGSGHWVSVRDEKALEPCGNARPKVTT